METITNNIPSGVMDEDAVRRIFRSSDAVCFDVDSTVCRDEAIDELAKFANKEKEVMEMTRRAMRGGCSFHDALSKRLQLIQPTVDMVSDYIRTHQPRFTPGIKELVSLLHANDVAVYLVSGGFYSIIEPVAKELHIPYKNIYANRIKFFYDGNYAGFDESEPTSQQHGKAKVIAYLKNRYKYRTVTIIGDGVTDMEAYPPADAFIGFGGNQIREKVKKGAKWFATSFYDLIEELKVDS
ncbi:phosphoserine phosphatase-like protein [Dermatophagoides farinae]|uniref:Phosphoserine phosphatase n=1 Tax=Dermatophagoides farinae TaxID=6954 RepID=A0A9D4SDE3_DERFA|nr:phosphoserine phosphatase-like [Dermatophagoides farinae]KAH7637613.1 phosphoserine phosphatase-like protein [Dermatophagoides farinae]